MQMCSSDNLIDSSCYTSEIGGTIDISVIKPSIISSNFVTCSSSSPSTLFNIQLTVTSGFVATPTPTLEPLSLPSNFVGIQGAPFYAISLTVVLFMLYGVVLVRLRDASDTLTHLKLADACLELSLFGATIASEFAYIHAVLKYSDGVLKTFAIVILVARLSHVPGGCYILIKLMAYGDQSNHSLQFMAKDDLLRNRSAYSILFLTSFLDNTNIKYLPWLGTKVHHYY